MLQSVEVGRRHIDAYRPAVGDAVIEELRALAAPLDGVRVLHVNATAYGGGVAEILRSQVPPLRDLGVVADWKTITADQGFFEVTKAVHNGLQGDPRGISQQQWHLYQAASAQVAAQLEESYDVVIVHDPQPLALPHLHGRGDAVWVWRCHIDSSQPNPQVWARLRPLLAAYDAAVFHPRRVRPARRTRGGRGGRGPCFRRPSCPTHCGVGCAVARRIRMRVVACSMTAKTYRHSETWECSNSCPCG